MKQLIIILAFITFGCASKSKINSELKSDNTDKVNDSIEKLFMEGKYFEATFIRLNKDSDAFIYIEDDYAKKNIKDGKIKRLFLKTKGLTTDNREDYYNKIISGLPIEDIEIHKKVWNIEEVKKQQAGDGGMYTLATWITGKPTKTNPLYSIEVRRNYFDRFGICTTIGYIKINAKTSQILVNDFESGEDLPIEQWRKLQEKETE